MQIEIIFKQQNGYKNKNKKNYNNSNKTKLKILSRIRG